MYEYGKETNLYDVLDVLESCRASVMQATNRKSRRSVQIHLYVTHPSHFSEIVAQHADFHSYYVRGRRGKR